MSKASATDRQWEKWGSHNPYRGVLGVETSQMDDRSRSEFFASGEQHIAQVFDLLTRHFGPFSRQSSALDFGCGVGRLLAPLASRFERVVGVDISPSMLREARGNLGERPSIELVQGLENVPTTPTFDLVHTYIVMQHIRPKQGMAIIAGLLDRVAPGGAYAIHMTIGDMKPWRRRLNALRYRFAPAHWAYNLVRRRPLAEPITEMNTYNLAAVFDLLRARGCAPALVQSYDQNRHIGAMLLGRKAPAA